MNSISKLNINGTSYDIKDTVTSINGKTGAVAASDIATVLTNAGYNLAGSDSDTTYTFASGTNGFTVTPSSGSAQTITVTPSISNNVTKSADLTNNQIVLGSAAATVKGSGKSIETSLTSNSDSTVPTSKAVATYVTSKMASVLTYKGTIGSSGATVTALPASHAVGDVYVVKVAGTYAGKATEVGDYIICNTTGTTANDAHWDVINGENQVTNENATLAWGTSKKIATIDGTDINVSLPSNPNTNSTYKFTIGSTTLGDTTNGTSLGRLNSEAAATNGTTLSLVTTGEKAAWNAKTSNTGTITSVGNTSSGAVTVSSSNNTASFGNAVTVGSVGGVDLKFTMPGNPNTNTWNAVSSTVDGYVPKTGTAAAATIGTQSTEWVLTTTNGGTPSWRKLPTTAFSDNNTWTAASSSAAGYVPAATKGKFLHSNASTGNLEWVDDNNTTYTLAGLMGSSAKGSTTQPIYWNGSAFANTSYTLGTSVPSGAVFTDTKPTYSYNSNTLTLTLGNFVAA